MSKTSYVPAEAGDFRFVNREEELNFLENLYKKTESQAQFLILYGKRRVGKTELIKQFCKDKSHFYYLASKGSAKDQLATFAELLVEKFGEPFSGRKAFGNWRELFDYLGNKLKESNERLVLVVDEFSYLVDSDKAIPSFFQYGWDEHLKDTRVLLVLMGSSITMMYKHALVYSSPLYGRRTASWLLEPFDFALSKNFFKSDDFGRMFSLYALVGGIPAYLREMNAEKSVLQNIEEKMLTKGSFLFVEPELLLADEFKEPRKYLTILKAVGLGRTKYSDLLNDTGITNNILPRYLKTLIDLRLVKREVPVTEKSPEKSKKGIYSLADSFLRFYFSFVFPNVSLVESGDVERLFEENIEILNGLVAKAYEDSTAEFVRAIMREGKLPHFERLGRWWDRSNEIDLVGLNDKENSILFAEAKWSDSLVDGRVIYNLKRKAKEVKWGRPGRKEYFVVAAKSGFTKEAKSIAEKENVLLIKEDKVL